MTKGTSRSLVTFLFPLLKSLKGMGIVEGLYSREGVPSFGCMGGYCGCHSCLKSREVHVEFIEGKNYTPPKTKNT